MPDLDQLREAARQLLRALEGVEQDGDLAARLREAVAAADAVARAGQSGRAEARPSATDADRAALAAAVIDREFIRTRIVPELERYWRRQNGRP